MELWAYRCKVILFGIVIRPVLFVIWMDLFSCDSAVIFTVMFETLYALFDNMGPQL